MILEGNERAAYWGQPSACWLAWLSLPCLSTFGGCCLLFSAQRKVADASSRPSACVPGAIFCVGKITYQPGLREALSNKVPWGVHLGPLPSRTGRAFMHQAGASPRRSNCSWRSPVLHQLRDSI